MNEQDEPAFEARPAHANSRDALAYACFAENGNIRIWSRDSKVVHDVAEKNGWECVPLFTHSQPAHAQPSISSMVDRFLGWKMPMDFAPDGGISIDTVVAGRNGWPSGTNLFNAKQATELFAYVLGKIDTQPNKAPDHSEQTLEKVQLKRLSRYETAALAEQYPDDMEAYAEALMDAIIAKNRHRVTYSEPKGARDEN